MQINLMEDDMPRGNRRGPAGAGPMTGRGMGYCAGYDVPGYASGPGGGMGAHYGYGRGPGRGRMGGYRHPGRGMGWGRPVYPWGYGEEWDPRLQAPPAVDRETRASYLKEEIDMLSAQLEHLKSELQHVSGDDAPPEEDS